MTHGRAGLSRRELLRAGGAAALTAVTATGCDASPTGSANEDQRAEGAGAGKAARASEVVIAAAGDIAAPPHVPPQRYRARQGDTADLVESLRPHAVLALGDLQYEHGTLENFLASYDRSWGRFKDITYPVLGNHEFTPGGGTGFFDYFGDVAGPPGRGYYSVDLGTWHLIALNSRCKQMAGGCGPGSPQDRWLRADLAGNRDRPKLAFFHDPLFTSGPKGPLQDVRTLWQRLYAAGVDVVINGNEHNYERFDPQDADGNHDPERGITQFIVGTGGMNLLPALGGGRPHSVVRHGESFGVLKVVLRQAGYEWSFLPIGGGNVIDSGSRSCH